MEVAQKQWVIVVIVRKAAYVMKMIQGVRQEKVALQMKQRLW
jgi:hypothetical protein